MAVITLAHCNYLLTAVGDPRAFTLGPRESIKAIREISRANPERFTSALNSAASPFKGAATEQIRAAVEGSTRALMYTSFARFTYHLSRCRYVPTMDLMSLLPVGDPAHASRQEIMLTFSGINPGSIRRISPKGYAALNDAGEVVFIQQGTVLRAFKEEMILRLAIHALCWASGDRAMPMNLAYKTAPLPPGEIPKKVAENIARGAADRASYVFYAKVLLPEVVENAAEIYGIICGTIAQSEASSETDEGPTCAICRESLTRGATKMLECGHVFHDSCIIECIHACGNRCPTCRYTIRVPVRLVG